MLRRKASDLVALQISNLNLSMEVLKAKIEVLVERKNNVLLGELLQQGLPAKDWLWDDATNEFVSNEPGE